jgi:hypothetical protein
VPGVEQPAQVRPTSSASDEPAARSFRLLAFLASNCFSLSRRAAAASKSWASIADSFSPRAKVGFDRVAQVVVDGPGLKVAFGHPEGFLDLEELVVGADHELGGDRGAVRAGLQVRDVAFDPGQGPGLFHKLAVNRPGAAG